jgi:hypothetical protein
MCRQIVADERNPLIPEDIKERGQSAARLSKASLEKNPCWRMSGLKTDGRQALPRPTFQTLSAKGNTVEIGKLVSSRLS